MSIPGAASPLFIGAAVEAGPFQIDRSVRLNSADSAYFLHMMCAVCGKNIFIYTLENILFNSITNNLLIVDNMRKDIKEYTFNNKYKRSILKNSFKGEPGEIDMLSDNLIIGDFSRLDNFFYIFDNKFSNSLTLSSGDKTLKSKCFTIIDHDQKYHLFLMPKILPMAYHAHQLGDPQASDEYRNDAQHTLTMKHFH